MFQDFPLYIPRDMHEYFMISLNLETDKETTCGLSMQCQVTSVQGNKAFFFMTFLFRKYKQCPCNRKWCKMFLSIQFVDFNQFYFIINKMWWKPIYPDFWCLSRVLVFFRYIRCLLRILAVNIAMVWTSSNRSKKFIWHSKFIYVVR